jgi:carboxypeptidase PM20D1
MKRALAVLLLLAVAFLGVLAYGASRLRSRQQPAERVELAAVDADAAAERLAAAVRIPTVSHFEGVGDDRAVFFRFHDFLATTFPGLHAAASRELVADRTLLYTWKGRDPSLAPVLLCAHQDVVPVPADAEAAWTHPPFSGEIADGFVWGRGSMDDKGNLMAILEAAEQLLAQGFQPQRTVLFAFGHDEEVGGTGAQAVAGLLAQRGLLPEFVLDEGMAVVSGMFPGLARPVAMIGIAEKGYLSLRLVVEQKGGHSSTPPRHTAAGILATAIHNLERAPMPARIDGVVRDLFDYIGPELPFSARLVFGNLWLTEPLLRRQLAANPGTNAAMRTTTAVTMLSGSPKDNVLPSRAEAVVNFRLLPGDGPERVIEHVRAAIGDERVAVEPTREAREASAVSPVDSPDFERISRVVRQVFPEALVAPTLVLGGTDARHYGEVSQDVYRFGPYRFDPSDLARAHGIDERTSVAGHADAVRFFVQLLKASAS